MTDDILFNLEWEGLEELINHLGEMTENMDRIFMEELTEYGLLVEEGAKSLAHHKLGDLEDSINFEKARKVTVGTFEVTGGSNLVYALRRHEEAGRGLGTLAKPMWRGYRPGPKFLENAMKATKNDYNRMNEIILERILGE